MATLANPVTDAIAAKVHSGRRITPGDARHLWQHASDDELRDLAAVARARFHPADRATYMVMRIINYTNVCVAQCDYCAFYKLPGQEGGYVLSQEQVFAKLDELLALGGDLAAFNGGFNPHLPLDYYCDLFSAIRASLRRRLEFYALTIAEFMYLADHAKLELRRSRRALQSRRRALDHRRRLRDPHRRLPPPPQQVQIHRRRILRRPARPRRSRPAHLRHHGHRLRRDHRRAHRAPRPHPRLPGPSGRNPDGLASFLCWTYKPYFTQLGGIEVTTSEYLRHLALSRIYLDNIPRIRTSVLTQNERALEGLLYGADDFDLPIEDEVTQKAGATISLNFERLLDHARKLGFTPEYRHVARM